MHVYAEKGNEMNVNEILGKRCLMRIGVKDRYASKKVDEYKILEISPSGNWAKLMNIYGSKFWTEVTNIALVEVLTILETCPQEKERK